MQSRARNSLRQRALLPCLVAFLNHGLALDPGPPWTFIRGDSNGDGKLDLADVVEKLGYLFHGGPGFACADSADTDDSGEIDVSDPIRDLAYLFLGGPPPAFPFPTRGVDMSPDSLDCGPVVVAGPGPCPAPPGSGTASADSPSGQAKPTTWAGKPVYKSERHFV